MPRDKPRASGTSNRPALATNTISGRADSAGSNMGSVMWRMRVPECRAMDPRGVLERRVHVAQRRDRQQIGVRDVEQRQHENHPGHAVDVQPVQGYADRTRGSRWSACPSCGASSQIHAIAAGIGREEERQQVQPRQTRGAQACRCGDQERQRDAADQAQEPWCKSRRSGVLSTAPPKRLDRPSNAAEVAQGQDAATRHVQTSMARTAAAKSGPGQAPRCAIIGATGRDRAPPLSACIGSASAIVTDVIPSGYLVRTLVRPRVL